MMTASPQLGLPRIAADLVVGGPGVKVSGANHVVTPWAPLTFGQTITQLLPLGRPVARGRHRPVWVWTGCC